LKNQNAAAAAGKIHSLSKSKFNDSNNAFHSLDPEKSKDKKILKIIPHERQLHQTPGICHHANGRGYPTKY
jgi:hypothetical protein